MVIEVKLNEVPNERRVCNLWQHQTVLLPVKRIITCKEHSRKERQHTEVVVELLDDDGNGHPMWTLLDTGCSKSITLKEFLSKKQQASMDRSKKTQYLVYSGTFKTLAAASVGFRLLEFELNKDITMEHKFEVDSTNCSNRSCYDIIIGSDILWQTGMNIMYEFEELRWLDDKIPMKQLNTIYNRKVCEMLYSIHTDSPIIKEQEDQMNKMLDCDYSKVDIKKIVNELNLTLASKIKLKTTLKKFPELFGGGLGKLKNGVASINLMEGATQVARTYYNLPKAYEETARKEIKHMVEIGVLKQLSPFEETTWAAPSFGTPKKTSDIRIVTDLRKMNTWIQRKPFPLPRIGEQLQKLDKFKGATALNLSQGFYTIPLDEKNQKICTMLLPWGKYAFLRLPMGVASAPDTFQGVMMNLLGHLKYVLVYIDDVLIIQKEEESVHDHLQKLKHVLTILQNASF